MELPLDGRASKAFMPLTFSWLLEGLAHSSAAPALALGFCFPASQHPLFMCSAHSVAATASKCQA